MYENVFDFSQLGMLSIYVISPLIPQIEALDEHEEISFQNSKHFDHHSSYGGRPKSC